MLIHRRHLPVRCSHARPRSISTGSPAAPSAVRRQTLTTRRPLVAKAQQQENKPEEQQAPSPQDMVKDAWKELNKDMTTASLLGEANFMRLQQAVGEDKVQNITNVLDPILKNRRAITVITAVVDVALIIAGIKVFQHFTA